ncbi:MAG: hypothetical protein KAS29_02530, partial [Bacteroidales bacterium]|nr:hypothetical protein [Bacteroidales bacterium]
MLHQLFRERMLPGFAVFIALSLIVFTAVSCEKSEGLGGTGSISGSVMEQFYNDDYSLLIHEKPAVDEDVFIV